MFYVYILKTSENYYVGYCSDLKRRLGEHLKGKVKSTKYKKPIVLLYYEAYGSKVLAMRRERNLKKFGSAYSGLIKRIDENCGRS